MSTQTTMLALAKEAQQRAYAPYSKFLVGACFRSSQNNFYTGCNVENISYGLTMCAENCALANMINAGERVLVEVLVIGSGQDISSPCGKCRQLIAEFGNADTLIHMSNKDGLITTATLQEILPFAFTKQMMRN